MILVINAGSSNVKFAIYDQKSLKQIDRLQVDTMPQVYAWLNANSKQYQLSGIGHRIVHGGAKFFAPVVLNNAILTELKQLIPLAPLHQPHNIAAVELLMQQYPTIPQVACFDTAFHSTQDPLAKQFAIPAELTTQGVIRYGFHGLSYEYIASVLEQKIGSVAHKKVIVAHLGSGASMCAMEGLKSVATSMGFSALDGLMMGTRCGNIDPGVLLYLLQEKNYSAEAVAEFLYNQCGLLGVSKISNDMRILQENQSPAAQNAIDLFCYRAVCEFCKLLAPLKGCDALIFTAGIGENAVLVREQICNRLDWMGVKLNKAANSDKSTIISTQASGLLVGVIPTDEELIIAKHAKILLSLH